MPLRANPCRSQLDESSDAFSKKRPRGPACSNDSNVPTVPVLSASNLMTLIRRGLLWLGDVDRRPGYVGFEQRAAYVGDVYNADEADLADDRQVPKTPARHDFGRVTDACRGIDDSRVRSHQLKNPDLVWVLSVRDYVRNVSLGGDADRLAGVRLRDDESCRIRVLHQVGGRGCVVVPVNRRHRWPHDVPGRSRGR